MSDPGATPFVVDIEAATLDNPNFRTTLWTGDNLQLTVMSIPPGGEIGLEVHHDHDQFLRVEQGRGRVQMGSARDAMAFVRDVGPDWAVLVPAGSWHNVTNVGSEDLRLYSLYGPPDHLPGTTHPTKADAENDPHEQH